MTGLYFHEYPLAPTIKPQHFLDVAADAPEDANMRPAVLAEVANLVREADALYASHHYSEYHFLLTLSDIAGGMGLEHGQSSDNGVGEKGFADDDAPTARVGPAVARVHALVEWQVSSAGGTVSDGLCHADAGRDAVGVRGHDGVLGKRAGGAFGTEESAGVQGRAGGDGGRTGLHARARVAADCGYRCGREHSCAGEIRRGRIGGADRTTTSRAKCCGWMRTR